MAEKDCEKSKKRTCREEANEITQTCCHSRPVSPLPEKNSSPVSPLPAEKKADSHKTPDLEVAEAIYVASTSIVPKLSYPHEECEYSDSATGCTNPVLDRNFEQKKKICKGQEKRPPKFSDTSRERSGVWRDEYSDCSESLGSEDSWSSEEEESEESNSNFIVSDDSLWSDEEWWEKEFTDSD